MPDRQPWVKEFDVRGEAVKATAEAYEAVGDVDAAMESYKRLAASGLPGSSAARAWYEQGRVAADARRDDEARRAFARAGEVKPEGGYEEVPYADMAKRAVVRLEAGAGVARPSAEDLARELAAALRRRDGRALRALVSPTHFAVGLGGHFHFADPVELLGRLEPDLQSSEVRVDARVLTGCGARRHVATAGWAGEWFSGAVNLTLARTRDGWESTGITPLAPTEAWVQELEPDEIATNQPITLNIKAPWQTGCACGPVACSRTSTSSSRSSRRRSSPFSGRASPGPSRSRWPPADCGFGPGVLYYNMAPTHLTSVASSAFAIDFVRYLQFLPYANVTGATPALAVAEGIVTVRDAGFVSGDGDPNHPNTVHIRHGVPRGITLRGGFRLIFIFTPFVSRYLHMAGPNLIPVSVGMFVRQGARLGTMDDTGSSAFDHLHFSIHDDAMGGASVRPNPMDGQPLTNGDDGRCILSATCRSRRELHVLERDRVLLDLEELRVGVDHRVRLVPHPQLALVHPDRLVGELLDRAERVRDEHDGAVLAAQLAHLLRATCGGSARRRPTAPRRSAGCPAPCSPRRRTRAGRTCPTSRCASACP